MNYTEALEFFVENNIQLTSEQLDNLKEASAFTRHMRNANKKYLDIRDARFELRNQLDNPEVKELNKKLYRKHRDINEDKFNNNADINPENYDVYARRASDRKDGFRYKFRDDLEDAKEDFNKKVNSAHPNNTKGKNDHKRAGDFLKMQKDKKALEN